MVDHLLDGRIGLRAVEQVARNGEGLSAALHQFLARSRQFIGIAGEQRDARSFSAKLACENQSKPAGSSRDQDDLAGKRTGPASGS